MAATAPKVELQDIAPEREEFAREVVEGLSRPNKSLPCKYFYDERGAALFEEICGVEEYYLTDADLEIMERHAAEMGDFVGPGAFLVEYGSGSGLKTRHLLEHLHSPTAYVPVDISREQLARTAESLAEDFPHIRVLPVCTDYTTPFTLPRIDPAPTRSVAFFPGSTIGNFEIAAAEKFLRHIARTCGAGGGLIIGVDLKKDPGILEAAYNDFRGVTAAFNLNLLARINRELDGNFDLENFSHVAIFNDQHSRIEMHLESRVEQAATVAGKRFEFGAGERICTEYSYKYDPAHFAAMAGRAGFEVEKVWTDRAERFSVQYLRVR